MEFSSSTTDVDDHGREAGAAVLARARAAVAALPVSELAAARWSGLGGQRIEAIEVREAFALGHDALAIVEARLAGQSDTVLLTLPIGEGDIWRVLDGLAAHGGSASGVHGGRLVGRPGRHAPARGRPADAEAGTSLRPVPGDQSHTSVVVDEHSILKLYRRLTPGPNPEAEVLAALASLDRAPTPQWQGAVDLVLPGVPDTTIAIEQAFIGDAPDAFEGLANGIADWLAGDAAASAAVGGPAVSGVPPAPVTPATTGLAAGRLHRALAGLEGDAFRPRLATPADRAGWLATAESRASDAVRAVARVNAPLAGRIEAALPVIRRALRPLGDAAIPIVLQRIHGDLHLGQVLDTPDGVLLIDFEGDPTRAPGERRGLQAPIRDVASFLRSIDHVARSGTRRAAMRGVDTIAAGRPVDAWIAAARRAFLDGYATGLGVPGWAPDRALLRALEVEKELGEFAYAATFLPAWLYAPAGGMRALLGSIVEVTPA